MSEKITSENSSKAALIARFRAFAKSFSAVGLVYALVAFCGSLTPSLIPRSWLYQGLISGLCTIMVYGIGTAIAWFIRRIGFSPKWTAETRKRAWLTLGAVAVIATPTMQVLGANWQAELRELFGLDSAADPKHLLVLFIATAIFLAILLIGRGLRFGARRLGKFFGRWVPGNVARLAAAVVVAVVAVLVFNGTIVKGSMSALDSIYSTQDKTTDEGIERPDQPERSGSEDSTVSWDSLGKEGRSFVAFGPSQKELKEFSASTDAKTTVKEPIRVYAGKSDDLNASAAKVVAELDRTDAWSRRVLVVAVTTGTGWVDPSMSDTLELLNGGDSAIAAMQYSYLPSWISFVSGRDIPPTAGRILFDTVYAAWVERPEDARPKLLVFGESLGSYGGQGAFSGVQDLVTRTDGALWIGTPNFTPLWNEVTESRDPNTLQRDPSYKGGKNIRWDAKSSGKIHDWGPASSWKEPRVAYVQHASDAVVWWSPDLIFSEPDWLREDRGPDVMESFQWMPVITFWQVSMDLFVAADVPAGHGHAYLLEYSDAWSGIAPPPGWTAEDTLLLRQVMESRPVST